MDVRAGLRGLAEDSLALLREAIWDERFPALFALDVYGAIIGMFELNNLGARPPPDTLMVLQFAGATPPSRSCEGRWLNRLCSCNLAAAQLRSGAVPHHRCCSAPCEQSLLTPCGA